MAIIAHTFLNRYFTDFINRKIAYHLPEIGRWLTTFLDNYFASRFPNLLACASDPLSAYTATIQIRDRETGFSVEGEFLIMNLKTTQEVDLVVHALNRKGGPAAPGSVSGNWTLIFPTASCKLTPDPNEPLKALVQGDSNATVNDTDVGIAKFSGSRTASDGTMQPVDAQIAINMIMSDAATIEVSAGEPREQA